jgi:hypothetical protein
MDEMPPSAVRATFARFPPKGPLLRAEGWEEQLRILESLAQVLTERGFSCTLDRGLKGESGYAPYFSVRFQTSTEEWRDLTVSGRFDRTDGGEHGLVLHSYRAEVGIASVEQLVDVLEALALKAEAHRKRALVRDRVRVLQTRSAEVQVAALARRMGFAYGIERRTQWVEVAIGIDEADVVLVQMPYDAVQEHVDRIEALVIAMRGVCAAGLQFRIVRRNRVGPLEEAPEVDAEE